MVAGVVLMVVFHFELPESPVGKTAFLKGTLYIFLLFCRNSGFEHTVLALWVSVLNTLYFVDRLWWISQCKYWSGWADIL